MRFSEIIIYPFPFIFDIYMFTYLNLYVCTFKAIIFGGPNKEVVPRVNLSYIHLHLTVYNSSERV